MMNKKCFNNFFLDPAQKKNLEINIQTFEPKTT